MKNITFVCVLISLCVLSQELNALDHVNTNLEWIHGSVKADSSIIYQAEVQWGDKKLTSSQSRSFRFPDVQGDESSLSLISGIVVNYRTTPSLQTSLVNGGIGNRFVTLRFTAPSGYLFRYNITVFG